MSSSSLACPHCSAPLRIQNRALVGKQIPCPDCGKPILVVSNGPRELALRKSDATEAFPDRTNKIALPESNRLQNWITLLKSPVGIAWSVAGLFALMMLIAAWPFGRTSEKRVPDANRQKIAENTKPIKPEPTGTQKTDEFPIPAPVQEAKQSEPDRPPVVAEKPALPSVIPNEPKIPKPTPDRPPVVAEIPPERINVVGALKQPIQQFHLQKPLPVRELLMLVDEMVPVPIQYKAAERDLGSEVFDKPISLKLDNTSVGDILKAILAEAELDYRIGINEIHVVKAGQKEK